MSSHIHLGIGKRGHIHEGDPTLGRAVRPRRERPLTWSAMVVAAALCGWPGTASAQGPQLSRLMRQKLQHSQAILQALVTSNWTLLETQTRELERVTEDTRWMVLKSPEYSKHSSAFVTALQQLRAVANDRESAKATEAYSAVVTSCVDCHRYVARARLAR